MNSKQIVFDYIQKAYSANFCEAAFVQSALDGLAAEAEKAANLLEGNLIADNFVTVAIPDDGVDMIAVMQTDEFISAINEGIDSDDATVTLVNGEHSFEYPIHNLCTRLMEIIDYSSATTAAIQAAYSDPSSRMINFESMAKDIVTTSFGSDLIKAYKATLMQSMGQSAVEVLTTLMGNDDLEDEGYAILCTRSGVVGSYTGRSTGAILASMVGIDLPNMPGIIEWFAVVSTTVVGTFARWLIRGSQWIAETGVKLYDRIASWFTTENLSGNLGDGDTPDIGPYSINCIIPDTDGLYSDALALVPERGDVVCLPSIGASWYLYNRSPQDDGGIWFMVRLHCLDRPYAKAVLASVGAQGNSLSTLEGDRGLAKCTFPRNPMRWPDISASANTDSNAGRESNWNNANGVNLAARVAPAGLLFLTRTDFQNRYYQDESATGVYGFGRALAYKGADLTSEDVSVATNLDMLNRVCWEANYVLQMKQYLHLVIKALQDTDNLRWRGHEAMPSHSLIIPTDEDAVEDTINALQGLVIAVAAVAAVVVGAWAVKAGMTVKAAWLARLAAAQSTLSDPNASPSDLLRARKHQKLYSRLLNVGSIPSETYLYDAIKVLQDRIG